LPVDFLPAIACARSLDIEIDGLLSPFHTSG